MLTTQLLALGILILCVVSFVTEWIPSSLTAILACLLFALFGICSFSKAFSGFSNSTVILVFGMMVIGDSMFESGIAQTIGDAVIKISGDSERRFILIAGIAGALMSMFMANVAVIAMLMAIMSSVCRTNRNINLKNICLATTMSAMFGGQCTLVGSTPQLTMQTIIEGYTTQTFKMWDFLPAGLCLTIIYMLYIQLVGYSLGKKVWGGENKSAGERDEILDAVSAKVGDRIANQGSKRQKICMTAILALMILLFVTEWVSNAVTSVICASLCVLTRCTDEKKIFKSVDWSVLFRLAGCLGIGAGIEESGVGDLIASLFMLIFGENVHPFALLAVSVLIVMIISNFISNSAALFVVLPPLFTICLQYNFNYMAFGIAVSYGASLCFATPLANGQTAMTMVAGYKFNDYVKYNILLEALVFAGIIVFVPVFWSLTL